jgi:hypothetical protein
MRNPNPTSQLIRATGNSTNVTTIESLSIGAPQARQLLAIQPTMGVKTMAKIQGEEFTQLRAALLDTLKAHNLHPFMVNSTRLAWQVFNKACDEKRIDLYALYKDCNDSHIETALKNIFKR